MNMSEITFEGKTQADWLAIRGKHVVLGPSEAKKEEALLWFENEEKKARLETEERRFQTQLTEASRHAWIAISISGGSLVVAILAFLRSSQSHPPVLPLSQPASIAAPQATNAAPSTLTNTAKP